MSSQNPNKKTHQIIYYDVFFLICRLYNVFGVMSNPQNDVFLQNFDFENAYRTRVFRKTHHNKYYDAFFEKKKGEKIMKKQVLNLSKVEGVPSPRGRFQLEKLTFPSPTVFFGRRGSGCRRGTSRTTTGEVRVGADKKAAFTLA